MVKVDSKIKRGKGKKTKKSPPSEDHGESSLPDLEIGDFDTSTQNCCFYSVPMTLVELVSGKEWFEPRVVSIGHYNCKLTDAKHKRLQVIQKHKQEIFSNILQSRIKTSMEELMEIIRRPVLEADARSCHYSQKIKLMNSETIDLFLRMLVLDGCFILELFRVLGKSRKIESDHPLASVAWAIPQFYGDLLLLENQIPFVVLKKLFETSKMPDEDYPLSLLALRFFNKVMRRSDEDLKEMSEKLVINDSLHLLDLVRLSFITRDLDKPPGEKKIEPVPVIYCITKLLKAGIKIKLREPAADSFLAVKFKNGVIEMPKITVDYFMHSFLVNCRAFEQLDNKSSKHITVYAYFLDCLVNTAKDVEYLYEQNIIDDYVGKNSEVVQFINKLGKEMDVETDQFYLYDFFRKVDDRYNKRQDGKMAKKGKKIKEASTSEDHGEPSFHDLEIGDFDTSTQNCCFYSVPMTLVELVSGKEWFEPRVVSIGHYNCKNDAKHKSLQVKQKHKQEFCSFLQSHAKKSMEELMEIIRPEVEKIEYKSERNDPAFLKMLVRDGCFMLELFRTLGKPKPKKMESNHPLASVAWAIPKFYVDLLLLENQIPFVVLKKIFETSKMPDEDYPLSLLALRFFNKEMISRSDEDLKKMSEKLNDSLHLLDLFRLSFITPDLDKPPREKTTVPVIYCITKLLRKARIEIKLREEADSFLAVKFKNGVIEMPKITPDEFMHSFLVNCLAFEQLDNGSSKHITAYAYFLDCLVNTPWDVMYLYQRNIIESYVGIENTKIVQLINKLGKGMNVETDQFYLYNVFEKVNHRYNVKWKAQWTRFKRRYFNTPWSWISALAAFVLLVLTFLQTYYTIYAYVNPK